MKAALLAVLLGGCITIVEDQGADNVGGEPGNGSGDGGVGPMECALAATPGPPTRLVAFELAPDGTQWMLGGNSTEGNRTLWHRLDGAWQQHLLDDECSYGVLAVDAQSRALVACAVRNATIADTDVRLVTASSQSTSSRLVAAAQAGPRGGRPMSIVVDANGRATVLWITTTAGEIRLSGSSYALSRETGAGWSTVHAFLRYTVDSLWRNDNARLFLLDGVLHVAAVNTALYSLDLYRVNGSRYEDVFGTHARDVRSYGYAFDYEVAKSADGKLHLAYADSSAYSDVAPGIVNYYSKLGENPAIQMWVDGSTPIGRGAAGLGGISMRLDAAGTPFIAYATEETSALRIARRVGTGWITQDVANGTYVGDSALRFDATGRMHIAFEDVESGTTTIVDEQCP